MMIDSYVQCCLFVLSGVIGIEWISRSERNIEKKCGSSTISICSSPPRVTSKTYEFSFYSMSVLSEFLNVVDHREMKKMTTTSFCFTVLLCYDVHLRCEKSFKLSVNN